jgi:hypothetical protein
MMESTLRRRAFSLIASTTEVDGAAEATLIKFSLLMRQSYAFREGLAKRYCSFNLVEIIRESLKPPIWRLTFPGLNPLQSNWRTPGSVIARCRIAG